MNEEKSLKQSHFSTLFGVVLVIIAALVLTGCPTAGGGGAGTGTENPNDNTAGGNVNANDNTGGGTANSNDNVANGNSNQNENTSDDNENDNVGDDNDNDNTGGEPTARTFVGTDRCLTCHGAAAVTGADMSSFLRSGHPFKLNKVVDGATPEYPFTSIDGALERITDDDAPSDDATPDPNLGGTDNTLGTPQSYSDISYVIGGFGWKARWIDSDGYIVTGSNVQYNFETDELVAYHNNETDKPYNCGNCHTTGWRAYTSDDGDDRNLNRQDDLAGMAGTFEFPGVQCEACHGAGSAHASAPSEDNITRMADPLTTADYDDNQAFGKPMACGDCHTRDGEKDYPSYAGGPGRIAASGGLIQHHEQYDEMLGINPDDSDLVAAGPKAEMHCTTCHNPHSTTIFQDDSGDPPGMDTDCTSCHNPAGVGGKDYALTGGMAGLACIDCHMPLLVKSAVKHDAVGTGPATGDIRSHIFKIDLTQENQFTEDGGFAYPWITGAFACKTCHNGETSFNLDFPSQATIHGD